MCLCVCSRAVCVRRRKVWSTLQWKHCQQQEDVRQLGTGTLWSQKVTQHHTTTEVRVVWGRVRLWATVIYWDAPWCTWRLSSGWIRVSVGLTRSACCRGTREHKGLDIKCNDGSTVYAPFDVTLNGRVTVYNDRNKAAINSGINLRGEGPTGSRCVVSPHDDLLDTSVLVPLF